MKEKTTIGDKYLLEHFYQTCSQESKDSIKCNGIERLPEIYSWIDVILDGEKQCRECEFITERQGFYYGKGVFSESFETKEYVTLNKIGTQEEFERVCGIISRDVKGIVIRGAVSDPTVLEDFEKLEFVSFEGHRFERFWNTANNPELRIINVWSNKHLKSLDGLEGAEKLEFIQFLTGTSDIAIHRFESLKPLSELPELKEVILSGNAPSDCNIDYLIGLPKLDYVWLSPNLFPIEEYAKFEARKFKIYDEYGIYLHKEYKDGSYDIWPFGKGKRTMHTLEQKQRYLEYYRELLAKYR